MMPYFSKKSLHSQYFHIFKCKIFLIFFILHIRTPFFLHPASVHDYR